MTKATIASFSQYARTEVQEEALARLDKWTMLTGFHLQYGTIARGAVIFDHDDQDGLVRVSEDGFVRFGNYFVDNFKDYDALVEDYRREHSEEGIWKEVETRDDVLVKLNDHEKRISHLESSISRGVVGPVEAAVKPVVRESFIDEHIDLEMGRAIAGVLGGILVVGALSYALYINLKGHTIWF